MNRHIVKRMCMALLLGATTAFGQEVVLTGTLAKKQEITATDGETCRIILDNVTLTKPLAITGDATLVAKGTSTLSNEGGAVVTATGALTLSGDGEVTLTGGGAKAKNAVIYSADKITVEGGTWNVNMSLTTAAKGFGMAAAKKLKMTDGSVNIVSSCTDFKDTGVYSDKKDIEIAGGILRVTMPGEKSVAINTDASDSSVKLTGGAVLLTMSGAGAKGVKTDGAFEMSGGILSAYVSGGPLYEAYEYGDGTNLTVTVNSSSLVSKGTYLIEDVTTSAAVKCGTVKVTGGTVRIVAEGICSRGLVADTTLDISGGVFDIQANGATSEPVIDLVTDDVLTQVELDRKTAACIKQGDVSGTAQITGGTFYLVATNYGGKCFSIDGAMTVGTKGATTLPTDTAFAPDIQCSTFGQKLYVAAQKLSAYTTLGTAVATTDASSAIVLSENTSRVVSGSGDDVDYTNPKCIKCEGDITFESGRLRMFSKNDGGEGLESKQNLTINGGIIEGTCYDDVIQATDTITVNGGYLYCGSTGNDGIDANDTIIINDGVVLAFTLTSPEVGIDVDSSSKLKINGGIVLAVGSASNMAFGSAGTQKSYLTTSASLSTYAGKYLKIKNSSSQYYYVKIPSASTAGGTCSLMCSVPGCTSTPSISTATTASGTDSGFHGVYSPAALSLTTSGFGGGGMGGGGMGGGGMGGPGDPGAGGGGGGGTQGGGGNQPGGGNGTTFTFDTFLTDSTVSGGCIMYDSLLTGYETGTSDVVVPASVTEIADGAFAGDTALVSIDLSATTLTSVPSSLFVGCTSLTNIVWPSTLTSIDAEALASSGIVYGGLLSWLLEEKADESSTVEMPASYSADDLRTWLSNAGNMESYLYAEEIATNANFTALSVSGTNFLFTAQDVATLSVVHAALQVSTDLVNWTTVSESDIVDGAYAMPSSTNGFARIVYTLPW